MKYWKGEAVYSIGEVAKRLELSSDTLRRWERNGLIAPPHRTACNWRVYSQPEIDAICQILMMNHDLIQE